MLGGYPVSAKPPCTAMPRRFSSPLWRYHRRTTCAGAVWLIPVLVRRSRRSVAPPSVWAHSCRRPTPCPILRLTSLAQSFASAHLIPACFTLARSRLRSSVAAAERVWHKCGHRRRAGIAGRASTAEQLRTLAERCDLGLRRAIVEECRRGRISRDGWRGRVSHRQRRRIHHRNCNIDMLSIHECLPTPGQRIGDPALVHRI